MSPLTDRERFAPTQPLPEYQDRLKRQRRWARPLYTPNHVPLVARICYALVSLTWLAWALVGLLSGHMFFLISRRGPIHFSGVPAVLFSLAVMACAAACAVAIVDHYDKRDNEEAYKRMRRRMWLGALAFLGLSACIGLAERLGILPYTSSALGLLSTRGLRSLLASSRLADVLAPQSDALDRWSMILMFWCFSGMFVLSKLGLLKDDGTPRPVLVLFMILCFIGPAVAAFTLSLVAMLSSGELPAPRRPPTDESVRAQLAWLHSMALTGVAMLGFLVLTVVIASLLAVGILPRHEPERDEA